MGGQVFSGTKDIEIYCEASKKPAGWDELWCNSNTAKIYWGATRN